MTARQQKVLNPRPRDQAADLSRLLAAAGFSVVEIPAIQVVPHWFLDEIAAIRDRLRQGEYDCVVFPSANAARFLMQALSECGGSPVDLCNVRTISGPGTASALVQLGLEPSISLRQFSGAAALDWIRRHATRTERILVPHAAEGKTDLVEGLLADHALVDAPVVYRTAPCAAAAFQQVAQLLERGEIAAAALTSPSIVRALVHGLRCPGSGALQALRETRLVCVGSTTADELLALGISGGVIAPETSLASLVSTIARILGPAMTASEGALA